MKLNCTVEVSNRSLPPADLAARRKPQKSCLAIGRQSAKTKELHLLWQTQQNKQGTKYKIDDNVDKVFTKFVNEGKATIRLIEPPHDLIIQSDVIQLKSFLHVLKLAILKTVDPAVLGVSNLNPKTISIPKTKVVIKKNSEYPTLQGFSRTTEELHLAGLDRKSFDRQILRLQSLKILNLSNNRISSLPKELGTLPNLQELYLSSNELGKAEFLKWTWLDQPVIKCNLRLLDISNNSLKELPRQMGKLNALVNLKVSQNALTTIPQSIGNMPNLKYLDLSNNHLIFLPGSMKNLRLLGIDISGNAFQTFTQYIPFKAMIPSLVEVSARAFLKTRRMYDASLIPFTLVKYLDAANYCICGTACFEYYMQKFMEFNLNEIADSVRSSEVHTLRFQCYLCSIGCLKRYSKTMPHDYI